MSLSETDMMSLHARLEWLRSVQVAEMAIEGYDSDIAAVAVLYIATDKCAPMHCRWIANRLIEYADNRENGDPK